MSLNPFNGRRFRFLMFTPLGWLFIAAILCFFFIIIVGIYLTQHKLYYYLLKMEADRAIHRAEKNTSYIYRDNLNEKYDLTDANNEKGSLNLVRGNGLNLLLIDKIPQAGYIKELLDLYRKSASGEIDKSPYHLPLQALLGLQYNETSTYPDGITLKSYLPYDNDTHSVEWNKAQGDLPAEAWTLSMFNKNMISDNVSTNGAVPSTYNGLRRSGSDFTGPFQIDRDYLNPRSQSYSSAYVSTMAGYKEGSSRDGDIYYVPDNLAYLNTQYYYMMQNYQFTETNQAIVAGAYGVWHNGGSGVLDFFNGFGTSSSSKLKSGKRTSADVQKAILQMPRDLYNGTEEYLGSDPMKFSSFGRSYGFAVWILLDNGYFLQSDFFSNVSDAQLGVLADGYNFLHGTHLSDSQVTQILKGYVRNPWDVYSSYMTQSQFESTYGTVSDSASYNKGILWKLDDYTSDLYKNKINGQNPRVLHRTNVEVAGFAWDLEFRGATVYANMLKLAGVGIDPTNVSDYLDQNKDEFVPQSTDFDALLKKLGVTDIKPEAEDMLKYGYDESGFWYYLGGQAKPISSANYSTHRSFRSASQPTSMFGPGEISERVFDMLYQTKDGTDPNDSEYNRRDSNLKYFGKIIMDCSSLVYSAYDNTIAKITGKPLGMANSSTLKRSSMLTTVPDWDNAQPGDIFVRDGHVFFFISRNTSGQKQTVGAGETKTGASVTAAKGGYWILEAADYDTRVGIRSRASISSSKYTLRRFNALE